VVDDENAENDESEDPENDKFEKLKKDFDRREKEDNAVRINR
jgi:hypothetical protein